MNIIELRNISEKYRIKFIIDGKTAWDELWVLQDVNITVCKGEVLGVIGQNGAGKTTLLRLIAGMLMPDKGEIFVQGKVSSLMELGAGFNPEFTGRENIIINARVYGLHEDVLAQKIPEILEFSGLGRFIDAPIKYYSQGMYMRLAFALAVFVEPDIFLVDDILSVGDEDAQQRCIKKIFELKKSGKTIVVVSHDMNIVSRLCDRVILLDHGRIVQEGQPGKVLSYYLETAGEKKGIASFEHDGIRVVFNNGRIGVSYRGSLITKGVGAHTIFYDRLLGSYVTSENLSWQISSISATEIIAEGWMREGQLSQVWSIGLFCGDLSFQVKIEDQCKQEFHMDFLLKPQYVSWNTFDVSGIFPPYVHKTNWQSLNIGVLEEGLVALSPGSQEENTPSIVFENTYKDSEIRLFNTGYDQESRGLQYFLGQEGAISIRLKTITSIKDYQNFVESKKKELLLNKDLKKWRALAAQRISCGDISFFVDIENKILRIFSKDTEITSGGGLRALITVGGSLYSSKDAQWQIRKISGQLLELTMKYGAMPFTQLWIFNAEQENTITYSIKMESEQRIVFKKQDVVLEVVDSYISWRTPYEEGGFTEAQYVLGILPVRLRESKVREISLASMSNGASDYLFLQVTPSPHKQLLGIYKQNLSQKESICVNSSIIVSKNNELLEGGIHEVFDAKIVLHRDISPRSVLALGEDITLENKELRFIFDQGRGRIFWGETEVTVGLGLFTSVRSSGIWHDSYQAAWDKDYVRDNKLSVTGYWPHIPIVQTWQIQLLDSKTIYWKVDMRVLAPFNLELEQSNLMLSSKYRKWSVEGGIGGEFLDEFTRQYDILPFRFWYGKPLQNGIVVRANLSSVLFQDKSGNEDTRGIVENSDYIYGARMLQYQNSPKADASLGQYTYFEGVIQVESEE
jgi:ABC-type polysaccharide/polyol phosphate transport system ATPase subunit